jgi:molecular chaperone GrpE
MQDDELKNEIEEQITPEEKADDVEIEEFEFNDGEEDLRATLKKLRKDLKDAKTEKQEYLTNWQRERADFVNYKKDEEVRRKDYIRIANERMGMEFLPILDSYDMAFANKEAWEKVDKNWRTGVEYIHQQLLRALADHGITEIEIKEGDTFNPELHQPMSMTSTDDATKDHTIERVVQKGYTMSDKVLRPARVTVYEHKS